MHEPLAQSAGKFTFDVTTNRSVLGAVGRKGNRCRNLDLPAGREDQAKPG